MVLGRSLNFEGKRAWDNQHRRGRPIGSGGDLMRVLFVHPSPLMYSEIYLRLEPLGMERVVAATRAAGHDVRIIDLQIFKRRDLFAELESFRPNAVGFSLNYLANVPEVID